MMVGWVQASVYVLRSCWPWLAMWCWLLISTYRGLAPSLRFDYDGPIAFEVFLRPWGWLVAGAVMLAGSTAPGAFWRLRPLRPAVFAGLKLILLVVFLVALPLWLETRMLEQAEPALRATGFWDGLLTFGGGMLLPAALAALFPSWPRFLGASLGFGLVFQGLIVGGRSLGFDSYFWMSRWAILWLCALALVSVMCAFRRPVGRRFLIGSAVLALLCVPIGMESHSVAETAETSLSGMPAPGLRLEAPVQESLADADHFELYARLGTALDEARRLTVRLKESSFTVPGGPVWRSVPGHALELAHGARGRGPVDALVMVLDAEQAEPFLDLPGTLSLEVQVESTEMVRLGEGALVKGAAWPWQKGTLLIETVEELDGRLYVQLGWRAMVSRDGFGPLLPTPPSIEISGWVTASDESLSATETPAFYSPRQSGYRGHLLLREVASYFPTPSRIYHHVYEARSFVPDPDRPPGGEPRVTLRHGRQVILGSKTLSLSGVSIAQLVGSGSPGPRGADPLELLAVKRGPS